MPGNIPRAAQVDAVQAVVTKAVVAMRGPRAAQVVAVQVSALAAVVGGSLRASPVVT